MYVLELYFFFFESRMSFIRIWFCSLLLPVANRHIKCNTIVAFYAFLAANVTGNLGSV